MTINQKFILDENGSEMLIGDDNYQVMMEWEKPYMEAIIDEIKPTGHVLEIGFGCAYSATRIQHYKPKSHTIIECDPVVIERARLWAKDYENIILIENTWQKSLHTVGEFDFIFFDDYPLGAIDRLTSENAFEKSIQDKRFFMFFDICLDWHMSEGSILSAYLSLSDSYRNNDYWNKIIINNPSVEYDEKIIDISVPDNCNYFKGNKAVIPIIRKIS